MEAHTKSEFKADNTIDNKRGDDLLIPRPPKHIAIDPTNICNLNCPLCPSKIQNYPKLMMSFDTFVTVLNKLPFVEKVDLFKWGEPLLHKNIIRFIREATSRNIQVVMHTNFSFY